MHVLSFLLCDLGYHSSSHSSIDSVVACVTSTNSLSSVLSSCDTYLIRSVIKIELFKIAVKISEVIYRLNLLIKIKIYPIQYIIILKPIYKDLKLLIYKVDTYKKEIENK